MSANQERRRHVERILVIYDDPRSEQIVRRILEPAGYGVITVPFGAIAMGVFHKTKPGLVVLDVSRPGKSGQDLCRRIRVNSESVPLLVLSAAGDVADVVLLLTLGADGYITKPFSPDEFLARVRAAMRHLIC
jgi:two-component system response regulator MtrA